MSFYKVLVIGDVGVGKTSMVNRIVYNTFTEKYKATIGCEFGLKIMEINGEPVRIQLWDLAGQDRLGGISRLYCRDANGALVVSDVSRQETLQKAPLWKGNVDENVRLADQSPIPMVLCANKYDMQSPDKVMTQQELDEFSEQNNFVGAYFTSAKNGMNAEEALTRLVTEVIKKCPNKKDSVEENITNNAAQRLDRNKSKAKKKNCC